MDNEGVNHREGSRRATQVRCASTRPHPSTARSLVPPLESFHSAGLLGAARVPLAREARTRARSPDSALGGRHQIICARTSHRIQRVPELVDFSEAFPREDSGKSSNANSATATGPRARSKLRIGCGASALGRQRSGLLGRRVGATSDPPRACRFRPREATRLAAKVPACWSACCDDRRRSPGFSVNRLNAWPTRQRPDA